MTRCFAGLGAMMIVVVTVFGSRFALAEPEVKYPIVITDVEDLKAAGIAFSWGEMETDYYENTCFFYGEGGYVLSVTDSLLNTYKSKGFSLQSLCMGLVSGIRFDPETGERLPTYIAADMIELKKTLKGKEASKITDDDRAEIDSGVVSEELPLRVPDCFKGGTPYTDCIWRYDAMEGFAMSAQKAKHFSEIGEAINKVLSKRVGAAACRGTWEPDKKCQTKLWSELKIESGETYDWGAFLAPEGDDVTSLIADLETGAPKVEGLTRAAVEESAASFYDISKAFPRGFGYALNADGTAGPAASAATIIAAHDGSKLGRQISAKRLKELIGN